MKYFLKFADINSASFFFGALRGNRILKKSVK